MPSCEIISIGTELLLGQILNTNAQYLSAQLASIGINCFFQTTVGDNKSRIISCLKDALNRADILLITGGLGPTPDDLTTECVAEAFGAPLVSDASVIQKLESFFAQRGVKMPESNRKQALRPEGATMLPNPRGTAPGIIWEIRENQLRHAGLQVIDNPRIIMTFPGVPTEMKAMWQETAVPYLTKKFGQTVLWSIELKHYGIGESALAEKYAHLLESDNPTVAPYAGRDECRLRVTARAQNVDEAKQIASNVVAEIRTNSGTLCYGVDKETLEEVVGKLLKEQRKTVALAESCTGGLTSKRLTDIAGSSDYTKLNVVTYANEAKHELLAVSNEVLEKQGAVSAECAIQMCTGVRKLAKTDLGISITGIAGPGGGTAEKPVGLVFIGLTDGKTTQVHTLNLPPTLPRDEIRYRASSDALNFLRLLLIGTA